VAGYNVYWETSITSTSPTTWTTSTTYDPPAVPSEAAHYLRVRTQDNAGNPSAWTPFAFKYDVTPRDNPITVDPGCAASDGIWQHTCNNPNFTWSGASDRTGSGVAGYNVYWGTSITNTSPAIWTTAAAYNPPAVPSGVPHHLRAQTADNVDNWSEWTTLFSLQSPKGSLPLGQTRGYTYDGQAPLISDTIPADGSVITTSWPVISATLTDPSTSLRTGPEPGSGVQPLSTTLIIDSEAVTPQVNTAGGFAYTPTIRLTEGVHTVTAQVYDQAGNQTQSGPWSFTVVDDSAPPRHLHTTYL
jgi:YD repeat-containing protein